MLKVEAAWQKLTEVIDPEIGLNIVDLGLVYNVECDVENRLRVQMTLTTAGCPMHEAMLLWTQKALESLPGITAVEVELVWDPPWHPGMMSEKAQRELGRR